MFPKRSVPKWLFRNCKYIINSQGIQGSIVEDFNTPF